MADKIVSSSFEAMQARLKAEFDRDMAEFKRIAEKYGIAVSLPGSEPAAKDSSEKQASAVSLTIKGLADAYRTDPGSPYKAVRTASRKSYDRSINLLVGHSGTTKVSDLDSQKIQAIYDNWARNDKIAMAHGIVTMLRGLVRFGMNVLKDDDCKNVAIILHGMQFPYPKRRQDRLTREQAYAICSKAHELGLHSIALAQAFQFDCMLSQKDVIGEWVPNSEPGMSEVTDGTNKWINGIRWNGIDDNLTLYHHPSAGGDFIEIDLSMCPMVMEEIKRLGSRPKSGPIIVKDDTKQPYAENTFRYLWRKAADAAGIPKTIYNRDSRPPIEREIRSRGSLKR